MSIRVIDTSSWTAITTTYDKQWRAFVTVHWFLTGEEIIATSGSPLTGKLYHWYLQLENKQENYK